MSQKNPYKPYPAWLKRYGPQLETFPHGEYLKKQILHYISIHKENVLLKEEKVCHNCQGSFLIKRGKEGNCPFCNAPINYNKDKIKKWLES